jgi:hypothetical protein
MDTVFGSLGNGQLRITAMSFVFDCLSVQPHSQSRVTAMGLVLGCFGNSKPGKAKGRQFSSSASLLQRCTHCLAV